MTEEMNTTLPYKKYISFISIYCLGISGLYLLGYWSSFGINVFEYININDIIILSIVNLCYGLFPVIFGVIITDKLIFNKTSTAENNSKLTRFEKYCIFFWIISCILSIVSIFIPTSSMWIHRAVAISVPLTIFIRKLRFLSSICNKDTRTLVIYLIIFIPFMSIHIGIRNANEIIYGYSYLYIDPSFIKKEYDYKINKELRYIGKLGDSILFYNADNYSSIDYAIQENKAIKYLFKSFGSTPYTKPINENIIIISIQKPGIIQFFKHNK